ncbi:MAG: 30S ribosomal protein S4 [Thermoprotei archaeon]|nr:30S ribosomal protein S4 [Thermoprotei archaeon]
MGDPKKPRKKWKGPRHPWRKEILTQELELVGRYGLRNKRELWIAKTLLRNIRHRARSLLALPKEEREPQERALVNKLYKMGLLASSNATIDDILNLTVEDVLERRLQTIVFRKGLARTIHQARQFIVHGHIVIGDRRVTSPGYLVSRDEEELVAIAPDSPILEKLDKILGEARSE